MSFGPGDSGFTLDGMSGMGSTVRAGARHFMIRNRAFNDISRKDEDAAGCGTQVYANLATRVNFSNGSTGTAQHDVSGRRARFVGPLDMYTGFGLQRKSPVGRREASDKLDVGARIAGRRPRRAAAAGPASLDCA